MYKMMEIATIQTRLKQLGDEIQAGMVELEGMLK